MDGDASRYGKAALATLVERWIRIGWQIGDAEALEELHTDDFVDHSPSGRLPNLRGFKQGVIELFAAFPDFHATIEDLVVEEHNSKVAVRWRATGTQRGTFEGIEASNQRLEFTGIEIVVIHEGRISERWGEWNGLELLRQISARE